MSDAPSLAALEGEIVTCRACPRLVEWRERVAREKRAAFRDWDYWGRPVPGFGDPKARLVVVGLAPAAHGANRTGRVFTGDRSGDWLFRAMHRAGFANQPHAEHREDGLELLDARVVATVRCAPPDNRPTVEERDRCHPYFERELALLDRARVYVALGGWALSRLAVARGRAPASAFRARRGVRALRRAHAALLVPPEPAEHLHRPPHGADVRRRVRPRSRAPRWVYGLKRIGSRAKPRKVKPGVSSRSAGSARSRPA